MTDPRRTLAATAEHELYQALQAAGYHVTTGQHNDRHDLTVENQLRIEVKASTWHDRYQAHYHNQADLLCWYCSGPHPCWFVIPVQDLATRHNLAIWSHNPAEYTGQWSPYREAWHWLAQLLRKEPT